MAYPELPDFDTSALDASKNGQELCNELKRLYDYLMMAVATQSFKWDSVTNVYLVDGKIDYIDFVKEGITIRKKYAYTGDKMASKEVLIHNVPPILNDWQFVFGQNYSYDSKGRVASITNRGE